MMARWLQISLLVQVLISLAAAVWWYMGGSWPHMLLIPVVLLPLTLQLGILWFDFILAAKAASQADLILSLPLTQLLPILARETWSSCKACWWAVPFKSKFVEKTPVEPVQPVSVLLVHGMACNRGIWVTLQPLLARRGFLTRTVTLEPPLASLDDYADAINIAVQRLLADQPNQPVAIVAHSMGGLAVRAYFRQFGDMPIAKVVTVGTPHQGTYHAQFSRGINVEQMRLKSHWLAELAASESTRRRAKFVCMYSRHDNLIAPYPNAILPGSRAIEFEHIGHLTMLDDSEVRHLLLRELERIKDTPQK